jgi:hypothetical protein
MNHHDKAKAALSLARECYMLGLRGEAFRLLGACYQLLKRSQMAKS